MNIVFVNHTEKQCGVYQYGKRMSEILKNDIRYSLHYVECDDYGHFMSKINGLKIDYIIYNWHCLTMKWLNDDIIKSFKKTTKQLLIYHESVYPSYLSVDGLIMTDLSENKKLRQFSIPRPIYEINLPKTNNTKLKFGSFGFGFDNKGFERICRVINENFTEVVIHLHITSSFFCDINKVKSNGVIERCKKLMEGSSNELIITSEFYENEDILDFLNNNSINIFLYDDMPGRGLSSVIDYAVSVNTPLVVNNSSMFRHLLEHKPNISIDNNDIQSIINYDMDNVHFFKNKWSNTNLKNKFFQILNEI